MKRIVFLLLFIGILFQFNSYAQKIKISASNKSLNKVLLEIRDSYDVDFSFNDTELAKWKVTVNKAFANVNEALVFLLKELPFEYEKVAGVYIIFPKKQQVVKKVKPKPKVYRISGRIMESGTQEVLPYSNILVNSTGIISDHNGNFLFSTTKDSVFKIKISHLGYLIEDTIFYRANKNVRIYLKPAEENLAEVVVKEQLLEDFSEPTNETGTIKLNHRVTKYLPGSSDNSVYNLLRLQPGVLAAGEQSNDLIIWGSYEGQSRVIFDGFTVFGLKNFNDNISTINPLITKNIQLRKTGYDASYGDCVGGIVDIAGNDGTRQSPRFHLGINNLTLNSLLEIPFLQKSSLQVAYRQTYYNLYKDGYNLLAENESNRNSDLADITIFPEYTFRDFNIKYNYKDDNNLFFVSFLNSKDAFDYSFNVERKYRDIVKNTKEENLQTGTSLFYGRKINNKLNIDFSLSLSGLETRFTDDYDIYSTITDRLVSERQLKKNTGIREIKTKLATIFQAKKNHTFDFTLQAINNTSILKEDSFTIRTYENEKSETYYTIAVKDVINLENITINLGARTSYLPYLSKTYIEPRVALSQNIGKHFSLNLAWGLYNQYLVKSSVVDEYDNYHYSWTIADGDKIPVLESNHYVAGLSYNNKKFSAKVDGYYKTTTGLTRYFRYLHRVQGARQLELVDGIYNGDGKSYGFDFYTKYNLKGHTFWLSYTWSESLEHFSYFLTDTDRYAPQDQRHEIKLASIINLSPFYLSANYVYGSGFLKRPNLQLVDSERVPYNRVDVSATYKFSMDNFVAECGVSILNLLNSKNQKFSNFEKIPLSQTSSANIYFEAVPFTPTLFLKIKL